jgi:hypothetical protein
VFRQRGRDRKLPRPPIRESRVADRGSLIADGGSQIADR